MSGGLRGLLLLALCLLGGCQSLRYYGHTIQGQWQMVSQRQPVARLLARSDTPPTLVAQLRTVEKIRAFAGTLDLPVRGQFDTYVDVHRPYALWSVAAAPELSLRAKTWCYWFFGCLSSRNFFDQAYAEDFERQLKTEGYDTYLGRVAAYSTLGWFRDSLLSSYIGKSEPELAELIFHELAHQVVYARNDPVFNESFAEVVAGEGLRRYLATWPGSLERIELRKQRYQQFAALVLDHRRRLLELYRSPLSAADKRARKQEMLEGLRADYRQLKQAWGGYDGYDSWFVDLGNAKLNSISMYNDLIPALTAVLARDDHDLSRFYRTCQRLARLPKSERDRLLNDALHHVYTRID